MLTIAESGALGPIALGSCRDDVNHHFGQPDLWGTQPSVDRATIWRYGGIEIYFENSRVNMLFSDHEDLADGGRNLHVAPWAVRRGVSLAEFSRKLDAADVGFSTSPDEFEPGHRHVVTESGAKFTFIDGAPDEFGQEGLILWSVSSRSAQFR